MDFRVTEAAEELIKLCVERKLTLTTAESCTGGLVVASLTDFPGSSAYVDSGYVTYSNEAKQQMLGVPANTLKQYGAVSRQTAEAMAEGAITRSNTDLAVAITGIAGPGGGTEEKPVGLVHFAAVARNGTWMHLVKRYDAELGRTEIRRKALVQALNMLRELGETTTAKKYRRTIPEPPKEHVIKEWPDRLRKI